MNKALKHFGLKTLNRPWGFSLIFIPKNIMIEYFWYYHYELNTLHKEGRL